MKIQLNGEPCELTAFTLIAALHELGYGDSSVVTAVNGEFVPLTARTTTELHDGDQLDVLAPLQGG
jgi:sulfur carrier protein